MEDNLSPSEYTAHLQALRGDVLQVVLKHCHQDTTIIEARSLVAFICHRIESSNDDVLERNREKKVEAPLSKPLPL